jgi:hypothetical protein
MSAARATYSGHLLLLLVEILYFKTLKADSHIACRAHAAPLPCSDSAVFFMKVRVVAENIRNASPTV